MKKRGRPLAAEWKDSNAAAKELGITARQLRELRKDGLFRLGEHYRIVSKLSALRPAYRWHVDRCAIVLSTPVEKRGDNRHE